MCVCVCYLSVQDHLHGIETASCCQLSRLEALVVDVDRVELLSQFVEISGLHLCCGLHLLNVLRTEHTHRHTHTVGR